MKQVNLFKMQLQIIKPFWRILISICVIQILGGVLGIIYDKYEKPLLNFWYGGAIFTSLGFLVGLLWHHLTSDSKVKDNLFVIGFIALSCISITIFAFFTPLDNFII